MPLGRICSKIPSFLIGKHKTEYKPNLDIGDHVVVINTDQLYLTGNKEKSKRYYKHSGYLGSTTITEFKDAKQKDSEKIIIKSVSGMLPKNKLSKIRMSRLHLYKCEKHPHQNIKFINI